MKFTKKDIDTLLEVYKFLSFFKDKKDLQKEIDHIYIKIKKIIEKEG